MPDNATATYVKPAVLPAWGETNTTAEDMIQPANGAIQTGWPLSATPPARQIFNWVLNYLSTGVRYFMQRGLPDYDATELYQIGGCVIGDDNLPYRSLVANNNGNTPSTSPGDWEPLTGLTLEQINASQLTQATQAPGDNTTKVATTGFVAAAIAAVTAAYTAAIAAVTNTYMPKAYTLTDVTGARAFGEVFENTDNYPRDVFITGNLNAGVANNASVKLSAGPNAGALFQIALNSVANGPGWMGVTATIPVGWFYEAVTNIGTDTRAATLSSWVEGTRG